MDEPKKRRIIAPHGESRRAKPKPLNLENLVNDALSIIRNELSVYRSKTDKGITLDLKEARAIQGYMDSLVKMSRESREAAEQQRVELLEQLSDDELLELAKKQLKGTENGTTEDN